jgi:glycosyltransferase 2 family protein
MPALTIRNGGAANRVNIHRVFLWLAVAIVCVSLTAAFRLGTDRGLRDTIGPGAWGRVLFGIGAAITQMDDGGYGYTISTIIETVLKNGGLTGEPEILAPLGAKFPDNLRDTALINAAIDKAARYRWPFNPDEAIRGSGGDDLGFVDYVRLSFLVFGHKIQSLYYPYFLIFGASAAVFLWTFRSRPALLMLLVITSVAQTFLFASSLLAPHNLGSIADPRFLGIMAIVPGLHLGCLLLDRSPPSIINVASAIVQSIILVFAFWIRASAIWVILAVAVFAGLITIWGLLKRQNQLRHIWCLGILLAVLSVHTLWVTRALHPIYRSEGEIAHHVFWHAVFYQLQFHPRWNENYAAYYDFATFDELPHVAAKKYLLRHPPPHPEEVYLTQDRQYLRIAPSEAYIRKAYFEFFANDPRFVLESLLIYNPIGITIVLTGYLSSLDRTTVVELLSASAVLLVLAGFLVADNDQRRLFRHGALLATGGFFVSLLPILLTVPNYPTMGDQYFALLIMLGCWVVLAFATGLRALLGRAPGRHRVLRSFFRRRLAFLSVAPRPSGGIDRMTAPSNRGPRSMFNLQTVVGLLVTGVIVWIGLTRIDLSQTMAAFAAVRIGFVLAGGGLIVVAIAIFAFCWRVLLPKSPSVPVRLVFCYLMIGYMINATIPLRLGDLVRAYLLGRQHGIAVSTTLSTVVVERFFDVVAIVIIGLLISTALDLPPLVEVGLRTFAFLGVAGVSLLYGLSFWDKWAKRLVWLNAGASRAQWLSAVLRRLDYFCSALVVLHDWKRLVATLVLTLAGWSVLSASLTMFTLSLGLTVPYLAGSLIMVATSLGASIPSAPGSAGVFHILTVLALSVWSVPTEEAVAVGVLAHGVTITLHVVLGVLCAWLAGIRLSSLSGIGMPRSSVGDSSCA